MNPSFFMPKRDFSQVVQLNENQIQNIKNISRSPRTLLKNQTGLIKNITNAKLRRHE